jgi:hypothetical protein
MLTRPTDFYLTLAQTFGGDPMTEHHPTQPDQAETDRRFEAIVRGNRLDDLMVLIARYSLVPIIALTIYGVLVVWGPLPAAPWSPLGRHDAPDQPSTPWQTPWQTPQQAPRQAPGLSPWQSPAPVLADRHGALNA